VFVGCTRKSNVRSVRWGFDKFSKALLRLNEFVKAFHEHETYGPVAHALALQAKSGEDPNEYTWAVFCMQAQLAVLLLILVLVFLAPEVDANSGALGQHCTSLHSTFSVRPLAILQRGHWRRCLHRRLQSVIFQ
jgi:hypothetical protein